MGAALALDLGNQLKRIADEAMGGRDGAGCAVAAHSAGRAELAGAGKVTVGFLLSDGFVLAIDAGLLKACHMKNPSFA